MYRSMVNKKTKLAKEDRLRYLCDKAYQIVKLFFREHKNKSNTEGIYENITMKKCKN